MSVFLGQGNKTVYEEEMKKLETRALKMKDNLKKGIQALKIGKVVKSREREKINFENVGKDSKPDEIKSFLSVSDDEQKNSDRDSANPS